MKKTILKALKACIIFGMGTAFFGCSMMMDTIDSTGSSSINNNVSSIMNRSDAEQMLYMGGSVLYSPKDPNANQLMEGAVVATRIGKVEKTDLGGGEYSYKNSKSEYELGFISIDSISID